MSQPWKRNIKTGAAALREKLAKKRRKENISQEAQYLSTELLSTEPHGMTQKYKRIGAFETFYIVTRVKFTNFQ